MSYNQANTTQTTVNQDKGGGAENADEAYRCCFCCKMPCGIIWMMLCTLGVILNTIVITSDISDYKKIGDMMNSFKSVGAGFGDDVEDEVEDAVDEISCMAPVLCALDEMMAI